MPSGATTTTPRCRSACAASTLASRDGTKCNKTQAPDTLCERETQCFGSCAASTSPAQPGHSALVSGVLAL
eukprot:2737296-Rhodomonas_salina.2